jgi:chromosomal replication initiator protein
LKAWEDFLESQEKELGAATVKKWLRPLNVVRFDACNLYLEAKDSFQIHWFEEHIRPKINTKFVNATNKRIKVHLSLPQNSAKKTEPSKPQVSQISNHPISNYQSLPFKLQFDEIDPSYTLETFIESKENKVALGLFHEIAQDKLPLGTFNPIFLWGQAGSGKTHLLQALTSHFRKKGLRVVYTKAQTFADHVVSAIRSSEMQMFRMSYRNTDILIIDDVQVFSKKSATQEELFHTFNTLHLEGKQIILSSNCPPSELQEIEERLVSRFEWGIVLPLHPLELDLLKTLFSNKAHDLDLTLQEDCINYLVQVFKGNTQNLIKALDALALRLHIKKTSGYKIPLPLSLSSAKELLSDLIRSQEENIVTPEKIIKVVAEYYGITIEDILGKSQSKECTYPRKIAMYLCRQNLKLPFMKIGQIFHRDHSTVMTSTRLIENEKAKKPDLASILSLITKNIHKS